jgi:excisionase family DNA binding protein
MTRKTNIPRFYTINDVAGILQVSSRTVRRRIEHGDLKSHKLEGLVRISHDDLQAYLAGSRRV